MLPFFIDPNPIEVSGRILPHPEIEFAHEQKEKPCMPEATWKGFDQYLVPAKLGKWMAIAIAMDGDNKGITQNAFRNFVENFRERMTRMGMQNPPPSEIRYKNSKEMNFEDLFKELERDCFEFVLFAHPDNEDSIHHSVKYYEQRTEVITQCIKNSTIRKFVESHQTHTMTNIVHKTNVKMGGLNYLFHPSLIPTQELRTFFGNEVLYIGFASNFPGASLRIKSDDDFQLFPPTQNGNGAQNGKNGNGSKPNGGNNGDGGGNNGAQIKPNPPTVIGFSANIGKRNWSEFVGDYVYQEPIRESLPDLIAAIVERCANQFRIRENAFPKSIVIFHNGIDADGFEFILKYEVPLVKHALHGINCNAKISLFAVNKRQPVRLFNIRPGTVVDTGIVRPNEFYLNSHGPIPRTAQLPRYNILLDENNLSMDTIQMICHVLCFGHQIAYSPTSLPTPVFVAEEYAKRGRNNFNTWASIGEATFGGIRNHQQLTNYLSMQNTHFLRYMRPNA